MGAVPAVVLHPCGEYASLIVRSLLWEICTIFSDTNFQFQREQHARNN
jgi:hypothetical protein